MSGLPSPAKPSLREGQDDGCSKSIIRILTVLMCVAVMTGELGLARVQAALPHEYVGICILQPPDPRPNPDLEGCQAISGQKCEEIGPAYPAGISDAGDVFGHIETNHPHNHHFEQGIHWLREDSYKGDFLGTFELEPKEWGFCVVNGRTLGLHGSWVSPDGIATGRAIPGAYHIDIVTGKVTVVGNGRSEKASGVFTTWISLKANLLQLLL